MRLRGCRLSRDRQKLEVMMVQESPDLWNVAASPEVSSSHGIDDQLSVIMIAMNGVMNGLKGSDIVEVSGLTNSLIFRS